MAMEYKTGLYWWWHGEYVTVKEMEDKLKDKITKLNNEGHKVSIPGPNDLSTIPEKDLEELYDIVDFFWPSGDFQRFPFPYIGDEKPMLPIDIYQWAMYTNRVL